MLAKSKTPTYHITHPRLSLTHTHTHTHSTHSTHTALTHTHTAHAHTAPTPTLTLTLTHTHTVSLDTTQPTLTNTTVQYSFVASKDAGRFVLCEYLSDIPKLRFNNHIHMIHTQRRV
jgi:hypothetical protein